MERVTDPADPRRCKAIVRGGQCTNVSVGDSNYCMAHGGPIARAEEIDRCVYELAHARSQGRLEELTKHDPTSFLYDVTSLAVRLLEKMDRVTQTDIDFVTTYSDINALILVVQKLKRSTIKIQQSSTNLVPKQSLRDFRHILVRALQAEVGSHPRGPEIITRVSDHIDDLIRYVSNEEDTPSLEASNPLGAESVFRINDPTDSKRLQELRRDDRLMSLYEEIAIQVMRVERRWNLVRSDTDLIAACGQLTQGLKKLEQLIKSAHDQAQSIGELLSPSVARQVVFESITLASTELNCLPDFDLAIDRLRSLVVSPNHSRSLPDDI